MLVHICCSVDSHYFLQRLRTVVPNEELIGYFYNPNIHPKSEHDLRLYDVQKSCERLGIKLYEGEYGVMRWMGKVRGLEMEPEKGRRCVSCFDIRLEKTAQKAVELGEKEFTTTLLTSPKKELGVLEEQGGKIAKAHNLEFKVFDFRKEGGTQRQFAMAKEENLYKQNYCGCLYALNQQRAKQGRTNLELYTPIDRTILPGSIEERTKIYLERDAIGGEIFKEKFQNYRILQGKICDKNGVIPSYIFHYSTISKEKIRTNIKARDGVGYCTKDGAILLERKKYEVLCGKKYESMSDLLAASKDIKEELEIRSMIFGSVLNRSFIAVVEELDFESCEIGLEFEIFDDSRDILLKL